MTDSKTDGRSGQCRVSRRTFIVSRVLLKIRYIDTLQDHQTPLECKIYENHRGLYTHAEY